MMKDLGFTQMNILSLTQISRISQKAASKGVLAAGGFAECLRSGWHTRVYDACFVRFVRFV